MFDIIKGWVDRHLSDEEGILFSVILLLFFVIIITMGSILAPLLTGIVFAYVMQGVINLLRRYNVPHVVALSVTFVMFMGGFIGFLVFIIPRIWRQMQSLYNEIPNMLARIQELLDDLLVEYPDFFSERQVNAWMDAMNSQSGDIGQWILSFSLSQLPLLVTIVVYMMLVPFSPA